MLKKQKYCTLHTVGQGIMNEKPRVGIGVFICKGSKILLGKRKNSHGHGAWACPGGALEFGETFEDCAKREVLEETGIQVLNVRYYGVTNDVFTNEGKHFVTIFMMADSCIGEPETREPEKCEGWEWFEWHALPEPLFLPLKNFLEHSLMRSRSRYEDCKHRNTPWIDGGSGR